MKFDFLRDESYVVQKGDSLYKIAKENNVTVDALLNANGLENTLIYPNQVLIIPKASNGTLYFMEYVVSPNDTLELIASKNNVTLEDLGKYNDLGKLYLITDQTLKVPTTYKTYTTVATDDINNILRETGMTLEELVDLNFTKLFPVGTKLLYK